MNKALKIGLIGIVIVAVIYFTYKLFVLPKVIKNESGTIVNHGDGVDINRILIQGDKGDSVTRLQQEINAIIDKYGYNYTKLSVDGIFGDKTNAAVKFVSANTLASGTVTISKVMALPNMIAGLTSPNPYAIPTTTATPTYSSGRTADTSLGREDFFAQGEILNTSILKSYSRV